MSEDIKTPIENKTPIKADKKCESSGKYIALIIIFAIIAAVGWYMFYQESQIKKQTITQLSNVTDEKEQVTSELNELLVQYDDISTSNDSLNSQLSQEKERIVKLIDEIKKTKSASRWQINKYKKELGTLRQIMRGYIHQIDSLNTMNVALKQENSTVKNQYVEVQNKNQDLENQNSELNSKIDIATTLRAMNIDSYGINAKGKPKTKAKKVEKIKTCFTLAQNKVTEPGPKDIYILITGPSGKIFGTDKTMINGVESVYSAFRTIEYANKDLDICVFWTKDKILAKGNYKVELFESGKSIGSTSFFLK